MQETNQKEVDEKLLKLKEQFWQVLDYVGDEELNSSCNSEYQLESTDVFRTDGNIVVEIGSGILYNTVWVSIRGASYVIIADQVNGKWRYDLRVDRPKLVEKYETILQVLSEMKQFIEQSRYYMDEWRR